MQESIALVSAQDATEDKPPSLAEDKPPSSRCELNPFLPTLDFLASPLATLPGTPQWRNWRWQMRNRIRSVAQLQGYFPSTDSSSGIARAAERFPLAITPYYASLIREPNDRDPVWRMAVPQLQELFDPPFLKDDPLAEDHVMPVPGLVHRYHDRALLLVTLACAMYCRYCTRKRVAGMRETCISTARLDQAVDYLKAHPEVRDVVVSGGDPFTMATPVLEKVLSALRRVPSVEIIRIGSRTPVTLPFRITDELVSVLRKYHPVYVNTHFNHPNEITPEAAEACNRLADAGVPIGNQSVLLKGVNDDPRIIEQLCRGLVRMRVRPYYLFQCDLVRGVEHFRTRVSKGIEIMEYLRGRLSGLAIPTFVVDAPGGGGKIPVLPNYVVSTSPTHTVLRNFEGMLVSYPEPYADGQGNRSAAPAAASPTVWDLASGRSPSIQPADSARQQRRATHSLCCAEQTA